MEATTIVLLICIAIALLCRAFIPPRNRGTSADIETGGWGGDGGGD